MRVQSLNECREILVTSDQVLQLIESGAVTSIDVSLEVNCCKKYNFQIFPGVENCEWEAVGDIYADGILFVGQPLEHITEIRGRVTPPGQDAEPVSVVTGNYDMTNSSHIAQLEADVNQWLLDNSVLGSFEVIIEDGIQANSKFTLKFSTLSSNFLPTSWRSNPPGSGLNVIPQAFRCDGKLANSSSLPVGAVPTVSSDWWGLGADGISIFPALMGTDKFPDAVYSVKLKVNSEDGTSVTLTKCLLMDCELKCKIARHGDENAALYYYLLKELEDCDCDCEVMCEILTMQVDPD